MAPPLLLALALTLFSIRGNGAKNGIANDIGGSEVLTRIKQDAIEHNGVASAAASSSKSKSKSKAKKRIFNRIDRITRVQDDENVILFPTLSRRREEGSSSEDGAPAASGAPASGGGGGGGWDVPIHGWVYEPEHSSLRRRAFLSLLRKSLDLKREEEANEILRRRLRPFLVDNERGKALTVEIFGRRQGGGEDESEGEGEGEMKRGVRKRMPRSHRNGHFRGTIHLTEEEVARLGFDDGSGSGSTAQRHQQEAQIRVVQPPSANNDNRTFASRTHLLQPTGLSVISDIDDTIKLSAVLDKRSLMRNTFLEEFKPVPGMSDLYRRWSTDLGAAFHFVSSSPWQLYPELSSFMDDAGFPGGSFHLKSIRIKDRTVLNLLADPFETKVGTIRGIMEAYPQRTFVLVGDTGEKDPEVYGEICRLYPGRVWRVYLRDVTGDAGGSGVNGEGEGEGDGEGGLGSESGSTSSSRYERAFRDVPDGVWSFFGDAAEVDMPSPPFLSEEAAQ